MSDRDLGVELASSPETSARQIAASRATPQQLAQLRQVGNAIAPILQAVVESGVAPVAAMSLGLATMIERLHAPQLSAMARQAAEALASIERQLVPILATLAEQFSKLVLPVNLASIDRVALAKVFEVGETEGIALYGVPNARITQRILTAPTSQQRRVILGSEANCILQECHDALALIRDPALHEIAAMAQKAVRAGLAGHHEACQALATVVLDGAISQLLDNELRLLAKQASSTQIDAIDALPFREALMIIPLARAHIQYFPSRGDIIPTVYSRHASVHAPGRRQYSKRNAVQAMLLLTSMLLFAEETRTLLRAVSAGRPVARTEPQRRPDESQDPSR